MDKEAMAAVGEVAVALQGVLQRVQVAAAKAGRAVPPRLVAVSKTKPAELIQQAYDVGHRDFGENYVQELCEKAPALPADIRWHFIGHLQSNKVAALVKSVPNLAFVETVDSERLARKLNGAVEAQGRPPLNVLVQVNTSGEESKSGVEPGAPAVELSRFIVTECAHLRLRGLMTIGMPDYTSRPENFQCLQQCRREVAAAIGVDEADLELSMGMSGDFEAATEMGSTNVRVGSTIFGARDYSK